MGICIFLNISKKAPLWELFVFPDAGERHQPVGQAIFMICSIM